MTTFSTSNIDSRNNILIANLPETKYGKLDLDLGASKISLDSTNQDLLSVDIRGRQLNYREDYKNNYETAIIDIETKNFRITEQNYNAIYDFYLNENII